MCDWDASAKMQIKLADRESHRAQRLDRRSWEIVNGLEQRMRNRQCSNTKKLGQSVCQSLYAIVEGHFVLPRAMFFSFFFSNFEFSQCGLNKVYYY